MASTSMRLHLCRLLGLGARKTCRTFGGELTEAVDLARSDAESENNGWLRCQQVAINTVY